MNWNELTRLEQLDKALEESHQQSVIIFKHSTSCSISRTMLNRIERNWNAQEMVRVKPYYLDLLAYRSISNKIADQLNTEHQSPQVLVIKNGKTSYDCSHFEIDYNRLKEVIGN
jgi:bacillithiol system protein YtxJ